MNQIRAQIRCYRAAAGSYHQRHAEFQALEAVAWPVPLRVAGYATGVSCVAGTLVDIGGGDVGRSAVALLLGVVIVLGLHKLSKPRFLSTQRMRFLVFAIQLAASATLVRLSFGLGGIICFYMLAAEIQFLLPIRRAIAGTALLWLVLLADTVIAMPNVTTAQFVSQVITSPAGFIFVGAFTRSAVIELVQRRRATQLLDDLNEAHEQLQRNAEETEALSVSRERNRMAREIHDTIGHYLTVINIQLESAQKLSGRDLARSEASLATAKGLATECLNEVRRSVAALRPAALDEAALPQALAHLIEELRIATGLSFHVETRGDGFLPPADEAAAYRVIQEALTNIRKHAQARNVWLKLSWQPEHFAATVRDDGIGADSGAGDADASAFGLAGMRERLHAVGGTLRLETEPGAGFTVHLEIPRCPAPGAASEPPARTPVQSVTV